MIGDGNPLEYGVTLPDGRWWVHPPYGPGQTREPLFRRPRRSWWRRLLRR